MALVLRPHSSSRGGRGEQGSEAVHPECPAHLVWLCPQRRDTGLLVCSSSGAVNMTLQVCENGRISLHFILPLKISILSVVLSRT